MLSIYTPPIWRYTPIRKLTAPMLSVSGRNNQGRITSFHRVVQLNGVFRPIDLQRYLLGIPAQVVRIERDPFRNAPVALIHYSNGVLSYIIAVDGLRTNNFIISDKQPLINPGNTLPIGNIPLATLVHAVVNTNVATYVRAAGTKAQVLRKVPNSKFTVFKLPSGELRLFHFSGKATIGTIEQPFFKSKIAKAGRARWYGRRPIVRGVAMNPIDHPHGGGEGKTSGGRPSCSPWGILTKGWKTRSPRKLMTHIFSSRFIQKKKKLNEA